MQSFNPTDAFPRIAIPFALMLFVTGCSDGSGSLTSTGGSASNLDCNGRVNNLPASVTGLRQFEQYSAVGDGYVRFSGTLTTSNETAPMQYEDYSNLAPYEGTIQSASAGTVAISVLDATGDNGETMLIYLDQASIGPPTILGQLTCVWY